MMETPLCKCHGEPMYRNARKHYSDTWRCRVKSKEYATRWAKENPERTREARRRWYAANREHVLERDRAWRRKNKHKTRAYKLKENYGLSLEDYERMLDDQHGRCAICLTDDPAPVTCFAVDHCHDSGKVRGLLCQECNHGIGKFRDDPANLQRAAAYLEKHGR